MSKSLLLLFGLSILIACKHTVKEKNAFRDLNKNGKLDVYEDINQPIRERIEDLLNQMEVEEKAGLLFMRKEEKLARDVYLVLFDKWGLRVFENIAQSEQRHMDAVLYLFSWDNK